MTKNQTVELLKKQLPGFYSVDQVIDIINGIEEDGQAQAYNENQIEGLIQSIEGKVERVVQNMYSEDLVDFDSADFSLCGKEISLDSVDADKDKITETVSEAVRKVLLDFFPAPKQLETA